VALHCGFYMCATSFHVDAHTSTITATLPSSCALFSSLFACWGDIDPINAKQTRQVLWWASQGGRRHATPADRGKSEYVVPSCAMLVLPLLTVP
jgi:hypothetical protein